MLFVQVFPVHLCSISIVSVIYPLQSEKCITKFKISYSNFSLGDRHISHFRYIFLEIFQVKNLVRLQKKHFPLRSEIIGDDDDIDVKM